jgi:general stress protein 26
MQREELKNKIIEVIEQSRLASVATINENKPWVCYMAV